MASIWCFLLLYALPRRAYALGTSGTVESSYLQEERSFCGGGLHCYSSLLQHNVAVSGSETTRAPAPRGPSIYVYPLPASLWINGSLVTFRDHKCANIPVNIPCDGRSDFCVFGKEVDVALPGDDGGKLKVRDIFQFSLGRIFWASLLNHPRRTQNPHKADLFYIPAFNTNVVRVDESKCATAEQLVRQLPYLNNETAARHFWLASSTAWRTRTCEVFQSSLASASQAARLLARTTKMALEDRDSAPGNLTADMEAGSEHSRGRTPPVAENLHSIPYPAVTSGLDDEAVQAWMAYTTAPRKRQYLVSAVWAVHGLGSAVDLRTELTMQCQQSPECLFQDLEDFLWQSVSFTERVLPPKLKSTFCLEPTGDTPSRKGMADSIVAGCIPVLFNPLQAKLWPWHVGRWEDVSILMAENATNDVIGLLSQVPEAEVERLRANMVRLVPRLTFALPGRPHAGDALETALAAVLATASESTA